MTTIYEFGGAAATATTAKRFPAANAANAVITAKTVDTFTTVDTADTVSEVSTLFTVNAVDKVDTANTVLTDKAVLTVDTVKAVNKVFEVDTVNTVSKVFTANTVNTVNKVKTLETVKTARKVGQIQKVLVHAPHRLVQFGPQERLQCRWPVVVLLDPTLNREDTALQLARSSGLAVVAIDSGDPAALGRIVDAIAPSPVGENLGWLRPEAIVLEAQHPVGAPPLQPDYALSASDIVDWLAVRGVRPLNGGNHYKNVAGAIRLPFILYTAHARTLTQVQALQDFAERSDTPELLRFAAVISRNQAHHAETLRATLLNLVSNLAPTALAAGGD